MFTGYTDQTVDVFWGIRFNNDRAWFAEHKQEFQDAVMTPTKALAGDLYDWFQEAYPDLHLNVHISRIYRDARRLFGRGPLNDHIWFSFQNAIENRGEAPCFWFQVGADGYGCGAGWWMPAASGVQLRRILDNDPKRAEKLLRQLDAQQEYTLSGPAYARPKGHAGEPVGRLYNMRSFSIESMHPFDERSSGPELTDWVKAGFQFLLPFYQLFEQAYGMADEYQSKARLPRGAGLCCRQTRVLQRNSGSARFCFEQSDNIRIGAGRNAGLGQTGKIVDRVGAEPCEDMVPISSRGVDAFLGS